jgi:molybdate-binding protein
VNGVGVRGIGLPRKHDVVLGIEGLLQERQAGRVKRYKQQTTQSRVASQVEQGGVDAGRGFWMGTDEYLLAVWFGSREVKYLTLFRLG